MIEHLCYYFNLNVWLEFVTYMSLTKSSARIQGYFWKIITGKMRMAAEWFSHNIKQQANANQSNLDPLSVARCVHPTA